MKYLIFFFIFLISPIIIFGSVSGTEYCSLDDHLSACTIEGGGEAFTHLEGRDAFSMTLNSVCIVYFYSDTCTHCAAIKPFLDEIEEQYGDDIILTEYEVSDPENIKLYNELCSLRGYNGKKIPLIGINDRILVGEDQIRESLEAEVRKGLENEHKVCPISKDTCHHNTNESVADTDSLIPGIGNLKYSSVLPVIIIAGLGDGINPCAFVILIFIMVFLQSISGNKKRLLKVTLTYIISLFITNLILGLLYFTLSINLGFPEIIKYIVIVISIVAGIINIKDFFFYGKGISLGIPKQTKKYLENLVHKASVSASFVLGVSVAILEAPCSVPIYLAVIEVLKGEGVSIAGVLPYIIFYNLMFILPLIVLSFMVYFGYRADYFEKASLKSKRYMKLFIGLILIALAIALLLGWL